MLSKVTVLAGDFLNLKECNDFIRILKDKLALIGSSTFTDTKDVRDLLIGKIIEKLRMQGMKHGIAVIAVDMRWGMKDENTLEHDTWTHCKNVILWCMEESTDIAFLSLQAEKYGYRPLPKLLEDNVELQERLSTFTPEDLALFFEWYIMDDNAVPRQYHLKALSSVSDTNYWDVVLPKLRQALDDHVFESNLKVGCSVTEYEVRTAIALASKHSVDNNPTVWFRRKFLGGVEKSPGSRWWDFDDTLDDESVKSRLGELIGWMEKQFEADENIWEYDEATFNDYITKSPAWTAHLDKIGEDIYAKLQESLDRAVAMRSEWMKDSGGLGVPGKIGLEFLHHCNWARIKCEDFIGRTRLIEQGLEMISERKLNTPNSGELSLNGIALYLVGESGCGKTALMARLAYEVYKIQQTSADDALRRRPVIVRFCGTSGDSATGYLLLQSIAQQMLLCHGLPFDPSIAKMNFKEVKTTVHNLLRKYPTILFIDSLDQLSNDDFSRKELTFLAGVQPHIDTRIIVSTLPDSRSAHSQIGYFYGCETLLKAAGVPRLDVPTMSEEEGPVILQELLHLRGRTLTADQLRFVSSRIAEEPTALYLRLAVLVVVGWTSNFQCSDSCLVGGVRKLLNQLFDMLSLEFGGQLVAALLGFITLSVEGVSDDELVDLLSLDENLMKNLNQYWSTTRLPTHVWMRVRARLTGLLVEVGGFLKWFHRQIWEALEERLSDKNERLRLHCIMARYFGNLVVDKIRVETRVLPQTLVLPAIITDAVTEEGSIPPIWNPSSRPNRRRCVEAAHHMLKAQMFAEVTKELCSWDSVCARAKCGRGELFRMVNELCELVDAMSGHMSSEEGVDLREMADHYARWLQRDSYAILYGSVEQSVSVTATAQPFSSRVRDGMQDHFAPRRLPVHQLESSEGQWWRGRVFGGTSRFDACRNILQGHNDFVLSVAFNADGDRIVSGSYDKKIIIWDAYTGSIEQILSGHTDRVNSVSLNADGSRVVSGSYDEKIIIWDAYTGSMEQILSGHTDHVTFVSFCADGSRVVSGSNDGTIIIWDVTTGSIVRKLLGNTDRVLSVAFNTNGSKVVSGAEDSKVIVWNASTGEIELTLSGHTDRVRSVVFSADGSGVASGSDDRTIIVWDVSTGSIERKLSGHTNSVFSVVFSTDRRKVVSASKEIIIWDACTGCILQKMSGHFCMFSVALSSDGNRIVSGSDHNSVIIWDVDTSSAEQTYIGHTDSVYSVAFNADSSRVVSGGIDKNVIIWDASTGRIERTLQGHTDFVRSVAFSADGSRVVSGSYDKNAIIWDIYAGKVELTLSGHTSIVNSVAFSVDGSRVVSGSRDRNVMIWNAYTGSIEQVLSGHSDEVNSVAFCADGSRLVSGSDDKKVIIWDAYSGNIVHTLLPRIPDKINSVTFSADGHKVVSGSDDGNVIIWDAYTGRIERRWLGHRSAVNSVAFSADGSRVVSGSNDRKVMIWNAYTGSIQETLSGNNSIVFSVAFSPDGNSVVSGSIDNKVIVWDATTGCIEHMLLNESPMSNSTSLCCWQ